MIPVPSYWTIYLAMLLSGYKSWAVSVFWMRAPQEPGFENKQLGLLLHVIVCLAKVAGNLIGAVVAFCTMVGVGISWPIALPLVDLLLAYLVRKKLLRERDEAEAASQALGESLANSDG